MNNIIGDTMAPFKSDEVNAGFKQFCPELDNKYTLYPYAHDRWLNFEETIDGKPTFMVGHQDNGPLKNYVYCKNGPVGPGWYHVLCKTVYVNLYSRLKNQGPPGSFFRPDPKGADLHDTVCRVLYARSRASKPDDAAASEQQIDHHVGTKLNPLYGLKA